MLATFSSEPPSQYCSVRKYARTSCAVPGMKRRIFGIRRSIFICCAPALPPCLRALSLALPRSRFSSASGPPVLPSMLNLPMRVSLVTSPADMQQTIASQLSRRARSAGSSGW